jgi:hypothetical protein
MTPTRLQQQQPLSWSHPATAAVNRCRFHRRDHHQFWRISWNALEILQRFVRVGSIRPSKKKRMNIEVYIIRE